GNLNDPFAKFRLALDLLRRLDGTLAGFAGLSIQRFGRHPSSRRIDNRPDIVMRFVGIVGAIAAIVIAPARITATWAMATLFRRCRFSFQRRLVFVFFVHNFKTEMIARRGERTPPSLFSSSKIFQAGNLASNSS